MKGTYYIAILFILISAGFATAQATEFTYQGSLKDGVNAANGSYDFEFRVFTGTGQQIGAANTRNGVAVANGVFSVSLDFGNQFPGADRFLEISVRTAGGGAFTTLTPRQKIDSSPYAIKSINAESANSAVNASQLGGVAANQYVVTNDARLTDARNPTAGSGNYIQNQNAAPQITSNFNVSGIGTANILSATTQYNIGSFRVLSTAGANNLFVGIGAGTNTTGGSNTFLGRLAGESNVAGIANTFVGLASGNLNTADANSFFGYYSGRANTTGTGNSFFGIAAGEFNGAAIRNSFFGYRAGSTNTADSNSFFGYYAGRVNSIGDNNSFFGREAGAANTDGLRNSFFGAASGSSNLVGESNSFFGRASGLNNTSGDFNVYIGDFAGAGNTTGSRNSIVGTGAGSNAVTNESVFIGLHAGFSTNGSKNTFVGTQAGLSNRTSVNNTALGYNADFSTNLSYATTIGSDSVASVSNSIFLGRPAGEDTVRIPGAVIINGSLVVDTLGGTTGNVHLCRNTANRISLCTSNLPPPEEAAALKERVTEQQKQIDKQKEEISELKAALCSIQPKLAVCK